MWCYNYDSLYKRVSEESIKSDFWIEVLNQLCSNWIYILSLVYENIVFHDLCKNFLWTLNELGSFLSENWFVLINKTYDIEEFEKFISENKELILNWNILVWKKENLFIFWTWSLIDRITKERKSKVDLIYGNC